MRDPKRIDTILQLLRAQWVRCPDMRLGQLLINLMDKTDIMDVFYLEDEKLEIRLRNALKRK